MKNPIGSYRILCTNIERDGTRRGERDTGPAKHLKFYYYLVFEYEIV